MLWLKNSFAQRVIEFKLKTFIQLRYKETFMNVKLKQQLKQDQLVIDN